MVSLRLYKLLQDAIRSDLLSVEKEVPKIVPTQVSIVVRVSAEESSGPESGCGSGSALVWTL